MNDTKMITDDTTALEETLRREMEHSLPHLLFNHSQSLSKTASPVALFFSQYSYAITDEIIHAMTGTDAKVHAAAMTTASSLITFFKSADTLYKPYSSEIFLIKDADGYLKELFMRISETSARVNRLIAIAKPLPLGMILEDTDALEVLGDIKKDAEEFKDRVQGFLNDSSYKNSDDLPEECFKRVNEIAAISWYALLSIKLIEAVCPDKKIKPYFDLSRMAEELSPMISAAEKSVIFEKNLGESDSMHKIYDAAAERKGEEYKAAYKEIKEILWSDDNRFGFHIGEITSDSMSYYVEISFMGDAGSDSLPEYVTKIYDTNEEAEEAMERFKREYADSDGYMVTGIESMHDDIFYRVLTNDGNYSVTGRPFGCRGMAFAHLVIEARPEGIVRYLAMKGAVDRDWAKRAAITDRATKKAEKRYKERAVPEETKNELDDAAGFISAFIDFSDRTIKGSHEFKETLLKKNGIPEGMGISVGETKEAYGKLFFPIEIKKDGYKMILAAECDETHGSDGNGIPGYRITGLTGSVGDLLRLGITDAWDAVEGIREDEVNIDRISECIVRVDE